MLLYTYAWSGLAYALSIDLVKYINTNAHRLRLFGNEDVSVGIWLSPLEIDPVHDTRLQWLPGL